MKAVLYEKFQSPPKLVSVADPTPEAHGVVVKVEATGVCRSDWHGWMGHDSDIALPHIPGHELAGVIEAVGKDVQNWKPGDRVTVPFICGCGACYQCHSGNQQVCVNQEQPGFTHWGSFAEYVPIHQADLNLIALPEAMDFATAASLGCRFASSFRAVIDQGRVSAGHWVAVHGCGGVGLSAVMIASAAGAQVIGVDLDPAKLELAQELGAVAVVDGNSSVVEAIREISRGGAHVSLDALGHSTTMTHSILCLRPRGKHIQVGLMLGEHSAPAVPMPQIVAQEIELLGSHGMQAHRYGALLDLVESGTLDPARLVGERIALDAAPQALMDMDRFQSVGVTVITSF